MSVGSVSGVGVSDCVIVGGWVYVCVDVFARMCAWQTDRQRQSEGEALTHTLTLTLTHYSTHSLNHLHTHLQHV
jgi:hypothetical protein